MTRTDPCPTIGANGRMGRYGRCLLSLGILEQRRARIRSRTDRSGQGPISRSFCLCARSEVSNNRNFLLLVSTVAVESDLEKFFLFLSARETFWSTFYLIKIIHFPPCVSQVVLSASALQPNKFGLNNSSSFPRGARQASWTNSTEPLFIFLLCWTTISIHG